MTKTRLIVYTYGSFIYHTEDKRRPGISKLWSPLLTHTQNFICVPAQINQVPLVEITAVDTNFLGALRLLLNNVNKNTMIRLLLVKNCKKILF